LPIPARRRIQSSAVSSGCCNEESVEGVDRQRSPGRACGTPLGPAGLGAPQQHHGGRPWGLLRSEFGRASPCAFEIQVTSRPVGFAAGDDTAVVDGRLGVLAPAWTEQLHDVVDAYSVTLVSEPVRFERTAVPTLTIKPSHGVSTVLNSGCVHVRWAWSTVKGLPSCAARKCQVRTGAHIERSCGTPSQPRRHQEPELPPESPPPESAPSPPSPSAK
jgi:hypothetical protein